MSGSARCIAPNLIGQGDSDKLDDVGPGSYRFVPSRSDDPGFRRCRFSWSARWSARQDLRLSRGRSRWRTCQCDYLLELGFDAAIDYKAGDLQSQVAAECPDGIDIFFDNVGGEVLDVALTTINEGARVVLCGRISRINAETAGPGPANYFALTTKRARMEGFIYMDYRDKFPTMIDNMKRWITEGKINARVDIVDGGVEMFPEVFPRLFAGENFGKLMICVPAGPEPSSVQMTA